jgi:K+-transporting ATPase KdpF subunit
LGFYHYVRPAGRGWTGKRFVERLREVRMNIIYIVGGIVALALLVYLVVAMLKPEMFS